MHLITGASGFLGGRLAQLLAERAEPVRIIARESSNLAHLTGLNLEVVRADLSDVSALQRAMQDVEIVFHCAAASTDWAPRSTYYKSNVTGVQNLLQAAARNTALQRFVHVSTTDVYGYPKKVCGEDAPLKDVGLPYNRTKCLGEKAVWEAHRRTGLPVTVVRPATIFGPRGTAFGSDIAQLLREGWMAVFNGGRARAGLCYVDNVAEAMMDAARNTTALGKAYNLCDGYGITWREYVDKLADSLKLWRPLIDLPAGLALPLGHAMEAAYGLFHIKTRPILTRHAVYLLARDQEFPAGRARADFGFRSEVGFEEGMRRMVEWLKP